MNLKDRHFWIIVVTGALMGTFGVLLSVWGNPENSGICVSCFIENSVGALGFHDNSRMQYLRPELVGFVLGAMLSAAAFREFRAHGGNNPLPRLIAGIFLIIGCAVFIGCPIKLFLRLTAGDLTALAGVAGLVAGVWIGLKGLANGVELGSSGKQTGSSGLLIPAFFCILLLFMIFPPAFILSSGTGSAAQYAPMAVSLGVGLLLGAFAQRSRFCITGSVRDAILMGFRSHMPWGFLAFVAAGTVTSISSGRFHPGMFGQPGAHLDHLWSFLGMLLAGWISVLIGGCPFRQLIKSGEGDADAGLVVVGMLIGGAVVQSWTLAGTAAGVPFYGKVAVLAGFIFILLTCLLSRERQD
ncbi:membrane protein, putative [Geotalea daltonii FRC-32]|uniref:Membrane protein, putative n=1 Tax=Geotalea daltonii (strain DSM 22248 / JCM 15807 / FRC-32) TaxID=316067 RepID=B9M509_GEODF|nr:YedE family putative selenium transporter [Geotalea daltonii]ACM21693.1 membrane protein, putative [Geotalea daltonii FRC-32]